MPISSPAQEVHDLLRNEMRSAGEAALGLAASLGCMRMFNNPLSVNPETPITMSPTTAYLACGQLIGALGMIQQNNLIEQAVRKSRKANNHATLISLMNIRTSYWMAFDEIARSGCNSITVQAAHELQRFDDRLEEIAELIHKALVQRSKWYETWRARLLHSADPAISLPWFLKPAFLLGRVDRLSVDSAPQPPQEQTPPEPAAPVDPAPQDAAASA